jgi:hypothetical protein
LPGGHPGSHDLRQKQAENHGHAEQSAYRAGKKFAPWPGAQLVHWVALLLHFDHVADIFPVPIS